MGKGGTRFVSDAIAVRAPRQRSSFSARELRRDMETYCETGVHPDIEKAIQEHEERPAETPLPLFDPDRPFVYFQFAIARKPVGRVTAELFQQQNPRGVEMLQNLCRPGSQVSLEKTCVHRLLPECAFFMGRPRRTREIIRRPCLNHTERGTVSISADGNEVAVTLREDTLALDETHHVVGRVHLGLDVLEMINGIISGPLDAPLDVISITKCGFTDHLGTIDLVNNSQKASAASKSQQTAQQLEQDAQRTQDDLKSALEEGLSRKRGLREAIEKVKSNKKRLLDYDLPSSTSSDEDV